MKNLEESKVDRRKRVLDPEGDRRILIAIREIVGNSPAYGHRKVVAILKHRYKFEVGKKRVERLMKENGLMLPATGSRKKMFRGVPFSLKVEAKKSNRLWGIDMTYIWCGADGWAYFHGVIDHHDKTLLGYNFSQSCSAMGGIIALAEAASKRPVDDLELRSDNGCHYGAKAFQDELRRLGIRHTRTMVNTPKGNAIIERFFKSLKAECVWIHRFENFEQAKEAVDKWIIEYNEERPHQALGYLSPEEYYHQQNIRNVA